MARRTGCRLKETRRGETGALQQPDPLGPLEGFFMFGAVARRRHQTEAGISFPSSASGEIRVQPSQGIMWRWSICRSARRGCGRRPAAALGRPRRHGRCADPGHPQRFERTIDGVATGDVAGQESVRAGTDGPDYRRGAVTDPFVPPIPDRRLREPRGKITAFATPRRRRPGCSSQGPARDACGRDPPPHRR